MREELEKKSKELEQTLQMQFEIAKKEYGELAKIGAVALGTGLLAFGAVKLLTNKRGKKKTKKVIETLEKEGLLDEDILKKLTHKAEPGILGRIAVALLPLALNYGKDHLLNKLKDSREEASDEPAA